MKRTSLIALIVLAALGGVAVWRIWPPRHPDGSEAQRAADAAYVGRATCAECHPAETQLYESSDHDRAMEPADAKTVLGNFNNARFTYNWMTSTFFRKGEDYWVRTDGPDGTLQDYRITYTFGVDPLQQYLIEFPDGRLQALDISWDSRPKARGGQRWIHLHPDEKVDYRDVLHWTGPALNWNYMCAECHSTDLRKNYRAEENRFNTEWSEIDVSCEACHGPASLHLAWASGGGSPADATKGFQANLSADPKAWVFEAGSPTARLAAPRDTSAQVETCGRCHSRRTQISEDWRPGQPLAQTHRVELLDEGLYQADGQILDEVYEYGSFLQSRMHAGGVTCTDCHEPHRARLRVEGNALCATCHQASVFDTPAHHHHREGTEAARCVACHMPARLYMVVDARRDHSFLVPRPDLSAAIGTPNPCTECHRNRPAAWAAEAVVRWFGPDRTRGPSWAQGIARGRRWEAGANKLLVESATSPATPAIARATATGLLARFPQAVRAEFVEAALRDADPLVRRAGLELLFALDPATKWELGSPLLGDPVRTVRLQAVDALADLPGSLSLPPAQRSAFDRAVDEYRAAQKLNADRADAWLSLGALDARLGNYVQAEAAYQAAIRLQPSFMPSYVNLADLYRAQGRDAEGERVLRQAIAQQPDVADVHHALGLLLVRQKHRQEALGELAQAAQLAPDNPRYAYVYGVALSSEGQHAKALAVLAQAQRRFTGHRDILAALVQVSAQTGDREAAAGWAEKLRALEDDNKP